MPLLSAVQPVGTLSPGRFPAMTAPMRILGLVLLVLLLVPQWSGTPRLPLLGPRPVFTASPVLLVPGQPRVRRIGGLVFERGYRLTSPDSTFGGFSSLLVDGDRFTLLSDGGNIVRFRLDAAGRVHDRRFAELPDGPWTGWSKGERDSESMTRDPAGQSIWVGFENANAIWRYAPRLRRATGHAAPPAMADWSINGGPEAMVRLRDGRFIVISETHRGRFGARPADTRDALLFATDPVLAPRRVTRFRYHTRPGFNPTDIAELPSGNLVLLNRRFSLWRGFEATVAILPRRSIGPGTSAQAIEIARFEAPFVHDNLEGIAVVEDAHGTALWIVSDDNQSALQQSLLMKFRFDPAWRLPDGTPP